MRSLVLFSIDGQGRRRIVAPTPGVGMTTIFSESRLLSLPVEYPGLVTRPSQPALPLLDEVLTVDPDQGVTMTFRVVDISPYEDANGDVPDPSIMVYYATRLT